MNSFAVPDHKRHIDRFMQSIGLDLTVIDYNKLTIGHLSDLLRKKTS